MGAGYDIGVEPPQIGFRIDVEPARQDVDGQTSGAGLVERHGEHGIAPSPASSRRRSMHSAAAAAFSPVLAGDGDAEALTQRQHVGSVGCVYFVVWNRTNHSGVMQATVRPLTVPVPVRASAG